MDSKMIFETMNAALDVADREAAAANKTAAGGVATKTCSRCGGKGEDYFFGGDRAPGQCYKCGGSGKVFVPGKAKKDMTDRQVEIELNRLRACWKAVRGALDEAKALPSTWASRGRVSELERRLAGYARAGKIAAESVKEKV